MVRQVPGLCLADRLEVRNLGVDSPLFSSIVLFKNQLSSLGFWRLCRKKDPWTKMELEGTPRRNAEP